ncbi:hypothetical protein L9F63_024181 [Diploptera punctata]|uniref:SURF1-like protein n=1 Tax=Diploptera punctata TaxID=6984 RepID=A0AAD8E8B7_DIPPU|nr:hypothetical protein L9F63_024181 [Diploptera punctata]
MISLRRSLLQSKVLITCGLKSSAFWTFNFNKINKTATCIPHMRHVSTTRHISNKDEKFDPAKWLLLLIPVTAFGLGTWQVRRRSWKRKLISDLKARTSAEPRDLPENLEELSELEYCPVRVRGEFDHSREMYMGPRTLLVDGEAVSQGTSFSHKSQIGYMVITPFKLVNRDLTILINRGWVPAKNTDPETRKSGQIEGEVDMIGVVRLDEKRAPFMPKNKKNAWFYRDLPKMAEVAGTDPIFLEAIADYTVSGGPIGGQTRIALRDEHLTYFLTWFGLSAVTGFMWYRVFVLRKPLL